MRYGMKYVLFENGLVLVAKNIPAHYKIKSVNSGKVVAAGDWGLASSQKNLSDIDFFGHSTTLEATSEAVLGFNWLGKWQDYCRKHPPALILHRYYPYLRVHGFVFPFHESMDDFELLAINESTDMKKISVDDFLVMIRALG